MNQQQKDAMKWLVYKYIPSSTDDVMCQLLLKRCSTGDYENISADECEIIKQIFQLESSRRVLIVDTSRVPHLKQIQSVLQVVA
jgi:hypothetical protein